MIATILCITFILGYLVLIGELSYGFDRVAPFNLKNLLNSTAFSIIIPFRNEQAHLPQLLESLAELNYNRSKYEIILVNDASSDTSLSIVNAFIKQHPRLNITCIPNQRVSKAPKKDAILTATNMAKNNWIITTDADCIVPKFWLDTFDEFIQTTDTDFIAGPVTYIENGSFLNRFQSLDFLSLQGATIGGFGLNRPFMCNGANLCYKLSTFKRLNGFKGNDTISSGDDVFLLEKFITYNPSAVHYLKSEKAIVTTEAMPNMKMLIQQRIRWASKSSAYTNWYAKLVAFIVFMANLTCVAFVPLGIVNTINVNVLAALFLIKLSIDFLLIFKASRFLNNESVLASYLYSAVLYPFFSIYIALRSLFKSYSWKDRYFKS